ncbi:nitroreductase [Paludibacter sp. 221]|uniref:nitroreductase family protein n=1 Tax=Paludibacter sp. 221 TaxID=2302939 RepID=UPI0013D444B8|nr:nitroreductase family protein [Paludibacter sp. 221]NDV46074.1 nitroreductase [Paludibacter sp. 221]
MNLLQAIDLRKSRRSYLPSPIETSKLKSLAELIDKYNEESGLSMYLVEDGSRAFNGLSKSYGMFKNVRTIIVLRGKESDADLQEKCGYYGELLVLEATAMNLGTCWVGASFDQNDPVITTAKDEKSVCVITVGNVEESSSFKENVIRTFAHGKAKPLEYFYKSNTTPPTWFLEGVAAVSRAPSAINHQYYTFEYKDGKVSASTPNKTKFDMVDLGIAKAHFVVAVGGKFEPGNNGAYFKD